MTNILQVSHMLQLNNNKILETREKFTLHVAVVLVYM